MQRSTSLLLAAMLMVTAGTAHAKTAPEARLAEITKGRTAGEAVNCIMLNRVDSTEIISRTAIVYKMNDGTIYVNRPASGANFLSKDDVLLTDTHSSQLCNVDIVRLLASGTNMPAGSVGLGQFVPYPKRRVLPSR